MSEGNPDPTPVRVLLVDDDPLVLTGLRLLLAGDPGLSVVAEVHDGSAVLSAVREHRPDVILMDIRMPGLDGISAAATLQELTPPRPEVIMLTTFDTDENVVAALREGAAGYLVKHSEPAMIIESVHRAARGEPVFSPSVLRTLVRRTIDEPPDTDEGQRSALDASMLTGRERDIARAVARGLSNAEIGAELYLSTGTVKADISTMLTKLGLSNRVQLAIAALDL